MPCPAQFNGNSLVDPGRGVNALKFAVEHNTIFEDFGCDFCVRDIGQFEGLNERWCFRRRHFVVFQDFINNASTREGEGWHSAVIKTDKRCFVEVGMKSMHPIWFFVDIRPLTYICSDVEGLTGDQINPKRHVVFFCGHTA